MTARKPSRAVFWTAERNAILLALYRQAEPKLSRDQIAAMLGTTFYAVRGQLCRLGVQAGERPGWTRGRGFARGTVAGPVEVRPDSDPDDPDAMPTGRVAKTLHRIWCLGPVQPRHMFWSDDPKRTRICPKCRAAMAGVMED